MLHRNLEHINPEYMRLDTRSENKQKKHGHFGTAPHQTMTVTIKNRAVDGETCSMRNSATWRNHLKPQRTRIRTTTNTIRSVWLKTAY